MNPFTRSLLGQIQDEELAAFVRRWDALEALVIRVYKVGEAGEADLAEHSRLRLVLLEAYPGWRPALDPHWRRARLAGELAREDPFAFLLAVPQAAGFIQNWTAMQTLPAAREALNGYLLERIESGGQ
jgi:hypothetical protein